MKFLLVILCVVVAIIVFACTRTKNNELSTITPKLYGSLLGHWKLFRADKGIDVGDGVTMEFSADGKLTYIIRSGDKNQIMDLTYVVVGDKIVTDQPSHPRREETKFSFEKDGSLLLLSEEGKSWFKRDNP